MEDEENKEFSESRRSFIDQLENFNRPDFINLENSNNSLNNIQTKLKLKYYYIHYRCPKCYNFPFIEFIDFGSILYTCNCFEKKPLKIEELFKENKYMTFLNNLSSDEKLNENIGFKCTIHNSEKNYKFRYYCINCKENICKICCQNHKHINHDLIILDYLNSEIYKKIEKINNLINIKK